MQVNISSSGIIAIEAHSGGIVGILAIIFNRKRLGTGNNGGGAGREPGIDIEQLERIRERYRDVADKLDELICRIQEEGID